MRLIQTVSAAVFVASGMLAHPAAAFAQERVTVTACVARELDYVRAPAPGSIAEAGAQVVLIDVQSGEPKYSLTGVREAEVAAFLAQRVELSGTVERARTLPVLTTADGTRAGSVRTGGAGTAGVTPDGAAAHEPSDALAATVPADPVNEPVSGASDRADLVATLPRLNATSVRAVAGTCAMPTPAAVAQAVAPAQPAARFLPSLREVQSVTVRGCLAWRTPEGTLALTDATVSGARSPGVLSAVPGSVPSGSGSGTVREVVGTSGTTQAAGFTLAPASGGLRDLSRHVGERVEVVGSVEGGGVERAPADTAHPSAATRVLTVSSFRALGGSCY